MPNVFLSLPLQNEGSKSIKIVLEPLSESFTIMPSQRVEVHAIFDENTLNLQFTVAPNDSCLIIYAPGEIAGFIDCYLIQDGVRLIPDPE